MFRVENRLNHFATQHNPSREHLLSVSLLIVAGDVRKYMRSSNHVYESPLADRRRDT